MGKWEEAIPEPEPPPWFGYQQVDETPYQTTEKGVLRWFREPGELHVGMCACLWVGPFAFYGRFAMRRDFQPAERR